MCEVKRIMQLKRQILSKRIDCPFNIASLLKRLYLLKAILLDIKSDSMAAEY